MDAGADAVLLRRRQNRLDRFDDRWFGGLQRRREAEGQAEVGGSDVHAVEPGRAHDVIQAIERFRGLDHRNREHGVVGVLRIIGARVQQRPHRTEAAVALGRVTASAHQGLGFLAGIDHRANHAVGAGVQELHDDAVLEPRDPRHRHCFGRRNRLKHGDRGLVIDQPVLQVDRQRVPSLMGHGFRRNAAGYGEPAVDDGPAPAPDGPYPVLPHVLPLIVCAARSSGRGIHLLLAHPDVARGAGVPPE